MLASPIPPSFTMGNELRFSRPRRNIVAMHLTPAVEADYGAIVELANLAYRGTGNTASWNVETGIVAGQRLDLSLLRDELAAKPAGTLLTFREDPEGELLGTVWVDPLDSGAWYLGLLAVHPEMQQKHLGSSILVAAEQFMQKRGARRVRIAVLQVRQALIGWYERRGYVRTGETEPFPYGDERFGTPLRDDLHFVLLQKEFSFPERTRQTQKEVDFHSFQD